MQKTIPGYQNKSVIIEPYEVKLINRSSAEINLVYREDFLRPNRTDYKAKDIERCTSRTNL